MDKIYILNNKMNLLSDDIDNYINETNKLNNDYNIIIAPSSIYLQQFINKSIHKVCSQNAYHPNSGAYTGEISFSQLKSLGVNYCIIGHSERRNIFNETDDIINKKISSCVNNNIIPILCVGESKEERENNNQNEKIKKQIQEALNNNQIQEIIIAYEPIWSIGRGITPTKEEIQDIANYIYDILNQYNIKFKILYGGSVDNNNINDILNITNISGVLMGGSSLKTEVLNQIFNK